MSERTKRVATYGLLVALAFVLSYLESQIPIPVAIPGIKLGLANLVVLLALCLMRPRDALMISLVRIILAGVTFGSPVSMIYSACGGICSFAVMALGFRWGKLSPLGVSVAGAVTHNLAQLAAAAVVLQTTGILWYLPVLLIAGLVAGAVIGVAARAMLPALERGFRR